MIIAFIIMGSNSFVLARIYNINVDFINVKFIVHNFKISHPTIFITVNVYISTSVKFNEF